MDPSQLPGQTVGPTPPELPVPSPQPQQPAAQPLAPVAPSFQPQPLQAPTSSGHFDPAKYEFITTPPQAAKKTLVPTNGSNKLQRIMFVVLGLSILLIVVIVGINLLSGGNKPNTAQLTNVAQNQTELIRVSTIGQQKGSAAPAKNIASMTKLSVTTQQTAFLAALTKQSIKIDSKTLSSGASSKTDQELKTAESNGRFDEAFIQIIKNSLTEYQKALQTAHTGSSSKSIKTLLDSDYQQTTLLLESIR